MHLPVENLQNTIRDEVVGCCDFGGIDKVTSADICHCQREFIQSLESRVVLEVR